MHVYKAHAATFPCKVGMYIVCWYFNTFIDNWDKTRIHKYFRNELLLVSFSISLSNILPKIFHFSKIFTKKTQAIYGLPKACVG